MTLFDELGGEPKVRALIGTFVDRVMDDVMIGFFFRNTEPVRLKEFEYQHAARLLGGDVSYEGRPLRAAHAPHGIMGGQFARRKQILREVLEEGGVAPHIREAWLLHTEKLRAVIIGTECL